jgi:hypothetical protein
MLFFLLNLKYDEHLEHNLSNQKKAKIATRKENSMFGQKRNQFASIFGGCNDQRISKEQTKSIIVFPIKLSRCLFFAQRKRRKERIKKSEKQIAESLFIE